MPIPQADIPISRRSLREQVHNTIRDAVFDGTLLPGERLRDEELSTWLGVSRTPIREALNVLAAEGLVEMVANRYTRVTTPDAAEVENAIQALGILFAGIVRITTPVLTIDQRQSTLARVEQEIARLQAGGTAKLVRTVDGGYQAWLDACPNPALSAMGGRVMHGLAYKLRVEGIETLVSASYLIEHLAAFGSAVAVSDATAAEASFKALHLLTP